MEHAAVVRTLVLSQRRFLLEQANLDVVITSERVRRGEADDTAPDDCDVRHRTLVWV